MKLLLLFGLFLSIRCYYEVLNMKLLHSQAEVANFTLKFENYEDFVFFNFDEIRVIGKICYSVDYQTYREDCYQKYKGFNSQWILLVNSSDYLNDLLENFNNDRDDVQAIIINNRTVPNHRWDLKKFITILSGNSYVFNQLALNHISNEKYNTFVYLHYFKHVYSILNVVFFVLCLLISVGLIYFTYKWHNNLYGVYYAHINQIQRSITFLPFLRIIISVLFTYFIYLYNSGDIQGHLIMSKYIEIIVQTLLSIYRTFFWFLILLISYGWIIYKQTISRDELKLFILFYITIYILIFFDPFFDSMFTTNIMGFKFSDLKNMVIFILFSSLIVFNSRKVYNKIHFKYRYAREYLPHYSHSLYIKMNMMLHIIILSVLYTLIYISIVFFFRKILNFFSNVILFESTLKINEDLFMLYFLYIFRPRVFPEYFTLSIEDETMNDTFFKLVLPSAEDLSKKDFSSNVNTKYTKEVNKEDMNTPIIIINPLCENEGRLNIISEYSVTNIIDRISFGYK